MTMISAAPATHSGHRRERPASDVSCEWSGEVTVARTAQLRESLYRSLATPGSTTLRLDVRRVTAIDRAGIAVLVGANRRAAREGRLLVLIDMDGPVTQALARLHLLSRFLITQVVTV